MMKLCVVGNGMIAERFLTDAAEIEGADVAVICVRSQSLEKGKELAGRHGVERVVTDFDLILEDSSIDGVYLGISNCAHYDYGKRALEAGKHVICEKPFTVSGREAHELAGIAKRKHLFLWEAFKIAYSPIYESIKENLERIGPIKMVQCNYSRKSGRYGEYAAGVIHPVFDPQKAGGCLYDINIYNIHLVTCLFGRPDGIRYYANKGYNGVDTSGIAVMEYGGFQAVCCGAMDSSSPCGAVIQGENGYIRVDGPVSSAREVWISSDGTEVRLAQVPDNRRLTREIREFVRQFQESDFAACYEMLEHSLIVMDCMDAARQSAGMTLQGSRCE